jgi:hypothetical protein
VDVCTARPDRPDRLRVLSGDACWTAGVVGELGRASAGGFLWRSDLRAPVFRAGANAFLFSAGAVLPLAVKAGPDTVRDPCPPVVVAFGAGRAFRFAGSGVGGGASLFTRDDFLTPFSNTVVGPLTAKGFQGGEIARGAA